MKVGFTKETVLTKSAKQQVDHKHVPGKAFEVENPSVKLINMIGGKMFNESSYYESGRSYVEFVRELMTTGKIFKPILDSGGLTEQSREVLETAKAITESDNPEDLFVIAAWARDTENGLKLRTTPQVLFALGASSERTKSALVKYEDLIIRRADEVKQVFAAWRHLFQAKGTIPKQLRKALAKSFNRFSDYQLLKYNQSDHPTFGDVLRVVGGWSKLSKLTQNKTGYPVGRGMYRYLAFGEVGDDAPEILRLRQQLFSSKDISGVSLEDLNNAGLTWENVISHYGSTREAWELVIPVMGEMALVRNLRNFEQAKISGEAWDKVYKTLEGIEKTNQLPFRFFSADREVSSTEAKTVVALMLDKAVASLRDLPGTTVVLVDNSGSATGAGISGKSNMVVSDAGNTLAAILAKKLGRNALVGVFGDSLIWVPFSQADSTLALKKLIDQQAQSGVRQLAIPAFMRGRGVGGGTETGLWWAFKDLTDRKVHVDRFVLLSDLCCYTQGDVNCGHNMKQYFGEKATVDGMVEKYRAAVNKDALVYSINLAGYGQTQMNPKGNKNFIMSGWSEKLIDLIADCETSGQEEGVTVPPIEVLRSRYGR